MNQMTRRPVMLSEIIPFSSSQNCTRTSITTEVNSRKLCWSSLKEANWNKHVGLPRLLSLLLRCQTLPSLFSSFLSTFSSKSFFLLQILALYRMRSISSGAIAQRFELDSFSRGCELADGRSKCLLLYWLSDCYGSHLDRPGVSLGSGFDSFYQLEIWNER